ncbi:VWA domain-containing protein [Polaribacter porphyrae]|uniref:VWA domain-containing protein n=1 Tax=Polaribacter porphyrae TaxID=1137780 RepID=UPI001FD5F64E|nr:VWA domain-containing protein [Polaribacter porphyrae]
MSSTLILYLILSLLLSSSVAFFQYYYKVKSKNNSTLFLFLLKTISLFLLILLLINPKINQIETENSKPKLSILIDDSKSISFFNETNSIKGVRYSLMNNRLLKDKFHIDEFTFGNSTQVLDSLTFTQKQTNISNAITSINELQKNKIAPILVLTDGNQTIGTDYEFINSKQQIYPIVFGDTTKYVDVKITQLNANKYSFIKNKFPVEVLLNYQGEESVRSQFVISKDNRVVFRKNITFSKENNSVTILTNLTSTREGLQYYKASISKIDNEKNIKNNTKYFSVEVINEQTKILVLSSILHPDIGALKKAIESNKQRKVEVFKIEDFKGQLKDYQLIILYQPNTKFSKFLSKLNEQNTNYLLISGVATDWNFINRMQLGIKKNAINQPENYAPNYNDKFLPFYQEDISFNDFPPLKDKFGEVTISKPNQTLLYQNINGLATQQPLLTTFNENNQKGAILFGEGIWKWRSTSFLNTNSFQEFDKFIGNLVQYLASNKKRKRLEVNYENLYPSNSSIRISAFYTDENYKFDTRASLEILIVNNETKEEVKLPFSLVNNSYQVEVENLNSGDYSFTVSVLGQKLKKYGRFKITEFEVENQFTNANFSKLQKLAENSNGKLYHENDIDKLIKDLLENPNFYTIQKSIKKEKNLINWKWILATLIILFSIEWFTRKYFGKI